MCGVFDGLDWVGIVEKWWKLWMLGEEVEGMGMEYDGGVGRMYVME